jgi:GMP synthase (glutamine-hydrolysing)
MNPARRFTSLCDPSGRPILGICYGMQALVDALGGKVAPAGEREYGPAN